MNSTIAWIDYRSVLKHIRLLMFQFQVGDLLTAKIMPPAMQVTSRVPPGCTLDDPEDVFSGIESAMHMDWRSRVRVIIHLGDAPQHGTDFHDMPANNDNYPSGDPKGRNLKDMLQYLREVCRVSLLGTSLGLILLF